MISIIYGGVKWHLQGHSAALAMDLAALAFLSSRQWGNCKTNSGAPDAVRVVGGDRSLRSRPRSLGGTGPPFPHFDGFGPRDESVRARQDYGGTAHARRAIADFATTGESNGRTRRLAALACCRERAGKVDQALALLDTVFETANATTSWSWRIASKTAARPRVGRTRSPASFLPFAPRAYSNYLAVLGRISPKKRLDRASSREPPRHWPPGAHEKDRAQGNRQ
jgi:hypothetical protein